MDLDIHKFDSNYWGYLVYLFVVPTQRSLRNELSMEVRLFTLALLTVAIRLFGNASVVILTGIDPRPVAVRKRIVAWLVSLGAAILAMLLAPYVASI